jgi:hypothetical protein
VSSKPAKTNKQAPLPSGAARQRLVRVVAEVLSERLKREAELNHFRDPHR